MSAAETIGQRIRRLRKRARLQSQELAREAGLAANGVSQIENGKRNPKLETIDKIAAVLGSTRDYLIDGDLSTRAQERPPASARSAQRKVPQSQALQDHEPAPTKEAIEPAIISAVQAAIDASLADLVTALVAALADWREAHANREARRTGTPPAGRARLS
jgi:transcriptional regulator with XRE-family HTH domain